MSENDRNTTLRAFFSSLKTIFDEAAEKDTGEYKPTFRWMRDTTAAALDRLQDMAGQGQRPQALRLAQLVLKKVIAEADRAIPPDNPWLPARVALREIKMKKFAACALYYKDSENHKRAALGALGRAFGPAARTTARQVSCPEPAFAFHSPVLFSGRPFKIPQA